MSSLDLLTKMLRSMRTEASIFAISHVLGDWAYGFRNHTHWGFHIVLHGTCWMHIDGRESSAPIALKRGDLVLSGSSHALTSSARAVSHEHLPAGEEVIDQGGVDLSTHPERTTLLCGAYAFSSEPFWRAAMPELLLLSREHMTDATRTIIALLHEEITQEQPGAQSVRQQLLDALLIHALRHTFGAHAQGHATPTGSWLGALRDPQLAKTIAHIHGNLSASLSVEELSHIAGMSRASFSRHFTKALGVPPMTYITQTRMQRAHTRLLSTNQSLEEIASEVGYANAFALSKAFKRVFGEAPSRVRSA